MKTELPSGLVVVVKRDCPTCELVAPVLADLASRGALSIYSQDDPDFPEGLAVRDDRELELSYHHDIEAVPTLLRVEEGREVERTEGWHRGDWEKLTGISGLGAELPAWRPGCGSLSQLPERRAALRELSARWEGFFLFWWRGSRRRCCCDRAPVFSDVPMPQAAERA